MRNNKDRSAKFGLLVALVLILAGVSVATLSLSRPPTTADIDTNYGTVKVLVNDEVGVSLSTATVNVNSDQTGNTTTLSQALCP